MALCKLMSFQPLPDGGAAYGFQNVDPQALAQDVAVFFQHQSYKFEGGTPMKSTWGTGSDTMRVLFGGFVKRYKFDISIEPQPPYVWLRLGKAMSGAMGGVIGYAAMNKELARITAAMQAFFAA